MRTTGAGARLRHRRRAVAGVASAWIVLAASLIVVPTTAAAAAAAVQINVPAAVPTIQGAIDVASPGDIVVVAPGTYHEHIDFLGKAIEVRSSAGYLSTTIDGGGLSHVVRFHSGEGRESILRGFTITHGLIAVTLVGGGVAIENASPTIVENRITDNDGGLGGGAGIGVAHGSPLIQDNLISGNQTSATGAGGGILAVGTAEIVHNRIEGNRAGGGGGVHIWGEVQLTKRRRWSGTSPRSRTRCGRSQPG